MSVKFFFSFSVDNSDFMRNGDFVPTRLQAQQDAVNLVCHSKTRSNPENNVGLLVMSKLVHAYCTISCKLSNSFFFALIIVSIVFMSSFFKVSKEYCYPSVAKQLIANLEIQHKLQCT